MRIIITGGNSGVGKATAAALAASGHQITLACRTVSKGERAAAEMTGEVEVRHLNLADLKSVHVFADAIDYVDVLINNAGVLGLPLSRTVDGFEAHLGTNHLGHYALTCLLSDRITDRIISVTSGSYALATLHLDDLNWHRRKYSAFRAYEESKLANVLFVTELARRGYRAYLSDPGTTVSDITRDATGLLHWLGAHVYRYVGMRPDNGARASIQAVTTDLPSGTCFAPRGPLHQWGKPKPVKLSRKARDANMAQALWQASAELTGCDLPWTSGKAGTGVPRS